VIEFEQEINILNLNLEESEKKLKYSLNFTVEIADTGEVDHSQISNWTLFNKTSTTASIQLDFSSPGTISMSEQKDTLLLRVTNNAYLKATVDEIYVPNGYETEQSIPS